MLKAANRLKATLKKTNIYYDVGSNTWMQRIALWFVLQLWVVGVSNLAKLS